MDFASRSSRSQGLLQKQMHIHEASLKQPLNEEIRRAAQDANVEIDMGIKAL